MVGQGDSGRDEHPSGLASDKLIEYVRDVMGWTGYQAEAYVAVVRRGPLEPSDIVAMTDVPQGRVYSVMGELEGEAVNVQGRQPKRYTAQHPRSVLADKRDEFTEKADAATDHLEQQHEIQRERDDHRHPAWVIPGISGTKRELLDAINDAEECVQLVERDGEWIQSNEVRDIGHVIDRGVDFEVIGWSRWSSKLNELVEEAGATAWLHDQVDSSFAIIDDDILIMRVGRGSTGVKIEDTQSVKILRKAFEAYRQEATEA